MGKVKRLADSKEEWPAGRKPADIPNQPQVTVDDQRTASTGSDDDDGDELVLNGEGVQVMKKYLNA